MESNEVMEVSPANQNGSGSNPKNSSERPSSETGNDQRPNSDSGSERRPNSDSGSDRRPGSENEIRPVPENGSVRKPATVERKPSLMIRSFFLGEPRPSPLPVRARSQQQPTSGEFDRNSTQRESTGSKPPVRNGSVSSSDEEDDVQSLNGGEDCMLCMFKNSNSNKKKSTKQGSIRAQNRADLQSTSIKNKNL